MGVLAAKNAIAVLNGDKPPTPVNPEVLEGRAPSRDAMVDDDPVAAWERVLAERGQWREDMRARLEAHRDELPIPRTSPTTTASACAPTGRSRSATSRPRRRGCGRTTTRSTRSSWSEPTTAGCRCATSAAASTTSSCSPARMPGGRGRGRASFPPKTRVAYASLDGAAVRVNAHLPGAIVRNVDIAPGPTRRTYDARVHTFPVNRPRRVVTVERPRSPPTRSERSSRRTCSGNARRNPARARRPAAHRRRRPPRARPHAPGSRPRERGVRRRSRGMDRARRSCSSSSRAATGSRRRTRPPSASASPRASSPCTSRRTGARSATRTRASTPTRCRGRSSSCRCSRRSTSWCRPREPTLVRVDHRLHPVAQPELPKHALDVRLRGRLLDHEGGRDLRVRHPAREEVEHLALARTRARQSYGRSRAGPSCRPRPRRRAHAGAPARRGRATRRSRSTRRGRRSRAARAGPSGGPRRASCRRRRRRAACPSPRRSGPRRRGTGTGAG